MSWGLFQWASSTSENHASIWDRTSAWRSANPVRIFVPTTFKFDLTTETMIPLWEHGRYSQAGNTVHGPFADVKPFFVGRRRQGAWRGVLGAAKETRDYRPLGRYLSHPPRRCACRAPFTLVGKRVSSGEPVVKEINGKLRHFVRLASRGWYTLFRWERAGSAHLVIKVRGLSPGLNVNFC